MRVHQVKAVLESDLFTMLISPHSIHDGTRRLLGSYDKSKLHKWIRRSREGRRSWSQFRLRGAWPCFTMSMYTVNRWTKLVRLLSFDLCTNLELMPIRFWRKCPCLFFCDDRLPVTMYENYLYSSLGYWALTVVDVWVVHHSLRYMVYFRRPFKAGQMIKISCFGKSKSQRRCALQAQVTNDSQEAPPIRSSFSESLFM